MPVKTEKPPIIEEGDFYLLGKQRVSKSEGDGKTLALLLNPRGGWFNLEQISEASGWRLLGDEISELQHRVYYNTSDRIEKRERDEKKQYRITTKN